MCDFCQAGPSPSPQGREGHCLYGEGEGPAGQSLLCQPRPTGLLCCPITAVKGVYGSFSPTPNLTCVLPSQTFTLFATTSPSILSPDLDNHGVWFKARWMERFFSPTIVVVLRSNP